jgi:hypothetical protein
MARESKTETQVRETITKYLNPNEILCEYTLGTTEESTSTAYFLFGTLGAALTGQNQPGFLIGLTDKRLILVDVKGKTPTGKVYNIPMSDIKGLKYRSSGVSGKLHVTLTADVLQLVFDKRPWWPRAKNMAKIMPSTATSVGGINQYINTINASLDPQSQALLHLEKAESYKILGLNGQVQYEMEQAKQMDAYVVQEPRYKALLVESATRTQATQALKTPFRVGAGMLFVNAVLGVLFLILILASGGGTALASNDFIAPIVNIIIGVNLWQMKKQWQKYTVWWAGLSLILFGGIALASGDYFSLITQIGFSGSLILLLTGIPSKVRTISAVVAYLVVYLGMLCLFLTLSSFGAL